MEKNDMGHLPGTWDKDQISKQKPSTKPNSSTTSFKPTHQTNFIQTNSSFDFIQNENTKIKPIMTSRSNQLIKQLHSKPTHQRLHSNQLSQIHQKTKLHSNQLIKTNFIQNNSLTTSFIQNQLKNKTNHNESFMLLFQNLLQIDFFKCEHQRLHPNQQPLHHHRL